MSDGTGRRVAIACQGGGSHTAFTAGVLQELVGAPGTRIAALSGTSGGAVCALLAWYGLLHDDPGQARDLLDAFWARTATEDPWETAWNELGIAALRIAGEVVTPEVSPYTYHSGAEEAFIRVLDDLIPFGTLAPPLPDAAPRLLVSAADVQTGEFRVFRSHGGAGVAPDHITSRTLLASAAVPPLFRAAELDGSLYWDGLFSQNPPIRELPDVVRGQAGAPPEEIWIVRINPDRHPGEPTAMADIRDRRNELAGSMSLHQEIFFIGHMNGLVLDGRLGPDDKYRPIKLRCIGIAGEVARDLDYASKLQRTPALLERLKAHGRAQGRRFLELLGSERADELTACTGRDVWGRDLPPG